MTPDERARLAEAELACLLAANGDDGAYPIAGGVDLLPAPAAGSAPPVPRRPLARPARPAPLRRPPATPRRLVAWLVEGRGR